MNYSLYKSQATVFVNARNETVSVINYRYKRVYFKIDSCYNKFSLSTSHIIK